MKRVNGLNSLIVHKTKTRSFESLVPVVNFDIVRKLQFMITLQRYLCSGLKVDFISFFDYEFLTQRVIAYTRQRKPNNPKLLTSKACLNLGKCIIDLSRRFDVHVYTNFQPLYYSDKYDSDNKFIKERRFEVILTSFSSSNNYRKRLT